jgi:hypothetical protein
MGILAFLMIVLMIVLSVKMGIETLATDLYNQNRISYTEYNYMRSFDYLWDRIKYILSHL